VELREIIIPLRKWWWLILAAALVAGTSGFLVTQRQPSIYSTRSTVMVGNTIDNPNPNSYDLYLNQQLANTYADIAKRDAVREGTMAALGLSWLPEYSARVVPDTQLVEITVTDTDPARAQAVANELVAQLAKLSPTGSGRLSPARQNFVEEQLATLETKIKETQDEITAKQDELAKMFSARQIADAQTQIAALQNKLATMQANYAALLSNTSQGAVNTINVIEPAALPVNPVGPNKLATVLLAVTMGVILAVAAAYLMEYLNDTLKNPDDVERFLGLTTLGAVPPIETSATELAGLASSESAATEAYRVLRTNLQFAAVGKPIHTLLITSPAPSEGKSLTAANLAVALAQAGRSVIVVDTDLHRPRQHRLFGVPNNAGVTTALLQERLSLDGLLQQGPLPSLRILTSGPLPPNAAELLGSAPMHELLALLGEQADMVLLDSPPTVALSDTAVLSTQTDGVLLVLDARTTRRDVARQAVEALKRVNAHIVGAVLNRMPTRGTGYYYYYHYSHSQSSNGRRDSGSRNKPAGKSRRKSRDVQPKSSPPETG
jgi:succinoglycan biosynthesis transport protein ExoP